jgi:hypothetical protein
MELALVVSTVPLFLDRPCEWVAVTYTEEGLSDGQHGLRLESGKWFSVQPDGTVEERDAPTGSYEVFTLDPVHNVVRVTPRTVSFAFPVYEL